MSEMPPTIPPSALEREFAEFRLLVAALREAVNAHGRARLVATNEPLSPGMLMSALLTEAGMVCAMWGDAQGLRPEDIEDVFNQALRNARRALHGIISAPQPPAAPGAPEVH